MLIPLIGIAILLSNVSFACYIDHIQYNFSLGGRFESSKCDACSACGRVADGARKSRYEHGGQDG